MLSTKLTVRDYGYDVDKRQIPVSSILYIANWCLVPEPLQAGIGIVPSSYGLDETDIDNHHRRIFE